MESISLLVLKFSTIGKLRITLFHKIAMLSHHCLWQVWSDTGFLSTPIGWNQEKIVVGHCGNHSIAFTVVFLGTSDPTSGLASHPLSRRSEAGRESAEVWSDLWSGVGTDEKIWGPHYA